MASDKRKIPVTERQFLWVQDDDKGEVILHVGPTMVSPTAADRVVIDDGQGGFLEGPTTPQRMIELSDSQYAVLYNPLADKLEDEESNGRFRPGRNESRQLLNGMRHMIPGPCSFYLRPGQRIEVRDAHELASNQYLVVKVYGEVDQSAPYYNITARSAAITTATAEDVTGESKGHLSSNEPVELTRGQLIVIRGLDTQFYIPPTGVDVVPDLSVDNKGTQLTAEAARKILAEMPIQQAPLSETLAIEEALNFAAEQTEEEYEPPQRMKNKRAHRGIDQSARSRQAVQRSKPSIAPQVQQESELSKDDIESLLSNEFYRQALEREVRNSRLVRQAVVLGEKEFCVILDADGKRQIKLGPARVFPGPYDSFMTEGSDNRLYYAYELLPQRALWLRFIAAISSEKLALKLPRGVALEEKEIYQPGDELILTGVNSFFFPFNEIEILHPLTGQPHFGNDHSDVFIEAIGIDQKSGIYVRDLTTGEVKLVRGKRSYLVDPRREVQITRTVSPDEWNLWISHNEPHKRARSPITTPWAISITVPLNTAVLAASAEGQRVIQGPCVELLAYDEKLVPMSLSTGTPKTDDSTIRTCYLRTTGNRVSDVICIETSDFVEIDVKASYHVNFEHTYQTNWFNHENYVGVLTEHLRSLVRSHCRQISLTELWPKVPSLIRDTILGARTESGRAGRLFEENGMLVTEVEVLTSEILDDEIAGLFTTVQRESVSLQIGDRQAAEQLRSERLRHDLERQRFDMQQEAREQQARLEALIRSLEHDAQLIELRNREAAAREAGDLEDQRELSALQAELERSRANHEAQLAQLQHETTTKAEGNRLLHEEEQTHRRALNNIEMELIDSRSRATVAERQAIQPSLVEALTGLGDKVLLSEVAQNMNLVSLFRGQDVATLFSQLVGGTKLSRTIKDILPTEE